MHADLDAIRKGIVFMADCEGMGWKNFSFEAEKRAAQFYQDAYPVRMKSIVMLDAPRIVSVFSLSLWLCLHLPIVRFNASNCSSMPFHVFAFFCLAPSSTHCITWFRYFCRKRFRMLLASLRQLRTLKKRNYQSNVFHHGLAVLPAQIPSRNIWETGWRSERQMKQELGCERML